MTRRPSAPCAKGSYAPLGIGKMGPGLGTTPAHLAPILQRLQIDVDAWLDGMRGRSHFLAAVVGALARLVLEVTRRA